MNKRNYQNIWFKNGEELTQLFSKSDVILLAGVIEKFVKVSTEKYGINPI